MELNGKKVELSAQNTIFALDIGTRSIIGMVGVVENEKVNIIAIEKAEHTKRAMVDGQIEDIDKVANVAETVKRSLEEKLEFKLERVCVAAAGRALRTERATFEMEMDDVQAISEEIIGQLEAGAISTAEEAFEGNPDGEQRQFYLAGYNVCQYYLDNYMMSSLKDHRGKNLKIDIIATFLPGEVVESLYTAMSKIGLEVINMTLEPIAAINAAIPVDLRLLNLVLVDIGAGTSDIAICREGSVIGYTMATVAGDEITETIMKKYLVDFGTAEKIKFQLETEEELQFVDILGFDQKVSRNDVMDCINDAMVHLCSEVGRRIIDVNGAAPSALFLAGGGSKMYGLKEIITRELKMDPKRVAMAGNNFRMNAFSEEYDLNDPEYTTPLGIIISAGLHLTNDGLRISLNGKRAKLFRSGTFTMLNLLMMNGYSYHDIMGKSGKNITVTVNGRRRIFYGSKAEPATLIVNGVDAKLSDVVQAGDNITFIPSINGKDAKVTLLDIEGIVQGMVVTVNGEPVLTDTAIKNGDVIYFEPRNTKREEKEDLEPFAASETMPDDGQATMSGMQEEESIEIKPEGEIFEGNGHKSKVGRKPRRRATVRKPGGFENNVTITELNSHPAYEEDIFVFTVNNTPINLLKKKNGEPFYLMDMLQYSGMDLDNISNPVILRVNGEDSSFMHTLKSGDNIEIYEKK
ncbi:cell division protein FtsA [Clostridiales bacterium]|nr:cell division protein FtsA [Clostridiales bacterium]